MIAPLLNPLNAELNLICHLLALLGAYPILHVSRIRVKHYTVKALAEQCLTKTLDLHQQSTSSPDHFTSGE
jgi:hypothetical protein